MSGLIGKKIGMTSIFDANGKNIPCTVIEAGPYEALQLGFDDKAEKRASKAANGHFKKAGTSPKYKVIEFQGFEKEYKLGDSITVDHFEIYWSCILPCTCIQRNAYGRKNGWR